MGLHKEHTQRKKKYTKQQQPSSMLEHIKKKLLRIMN